MASCTTGVLETHIAYNIGAVLAASYSGKAMEGLSITPTTKLRGTIQPSPHRRLDGHVPELVFDRSASLRSSIWSTYTLEAPVGG